MDKDVIRYYREFKWDEEGRCYWSKLKGVMVAVLQNSEWFEEIGSNVKRHFEEWRIGWSICGKKDQFCKQRGVGIARGRALKGTRKKVPEEMKEEIWKLKKWLETGKNGEKREVIISGNMD